MADNYYSTNNQNVSLHPMGDTSTFLYPRGVKNLTIAFNLVVNANGSQFPNCRWSDVNELVVGSKTYYYRTLMQSNNVDPINDISTIRSYLKFMTGSDYIPEYNSSEPNDEFIFLNDPSIADENRAWKYQYDTEYGVLQAFRVDNFPFALKSEVRPLPKTIEVQGTPDAEYNRIYFDINEPNLSTVKAISIRITIEENNKDNYGTYFAESVPHTVVFDNGTGILQDANWKWDSYEGSFARFQIMFDSVNPPVNYNDINFVTAEITLY